MRLKNTSHVTTIKISNIVTTPRVSFYPFVVKLLPTLPIPWPPLIWFFFPYTVLLFFLEFHLKRIIQYVAF